MTQTQCRGYGGVDWRRNILWQKGRYFAVLDELEALADGDFNFQCIWRTMGDIDLEADRMLVSQGAARFCLIKAGGGLMKLADVTPQAADRRALVETCPATLKAGERAGILNVFYSPRGGEYPYDAARLTETGLLVAEPDRHVLVAAGDFERGDVRCRAKLAALSAAEFSLLDATELDWGGPALRSDAPLSLQLDRRTGAGDVEVTQACRAGFRVGDGALKLDGKAAGEERDGLVWVELSPGNHNLQVGADVAGPSEAQVAEWFSAAAAQRVAAGAQATPASPQLKALWTADNPVVTRKDIFRAEGTAAEEVPDLAQSGTARYWEKGSEGSSPAAATDGDPETYCAVTSRAPNVNDVPKDLGIEWAEPVTVGEVWVQHYNVGYRPAEEGQDLQCWDGAKWVSIDDTITGAETAEWVHTFTPVQTTRIRLLVTKFNTMRTAIREMRVFSRPVEAAQVEVTRQRPAKALAAADVNGDGRDEVAAAVEGTVVLYDADGAVQWERDLGSPVQALTAGTLDGPALVASTADRRLHRIAPDGTVVWSVDSPKDKYFPEIEPAPGVFTVLAVGDIDADGDGEIVAGNSNWFAYGFDHLGAKLWGTLNWAHPALSIALGDVRGDGKLAALIGTRYNDANLFQWDGKQIASLGMGYHSCPCATALADLDGDGVMEMIGGSRIGGLQAGKLDGTRLWAFDMGAEVREVLAADLTGDGKVEVLAGSRNCYVLCLDAAGKVLWRRNLLDAIVSMLTADVNGDGRPEIVVGVEDGTLHVLDAGGAELNAFRTDGSITDVAIAGRGEGALAIIAGSADGKVYALGQ